MTNSKKIEISGVFVDDLSKEDAASKIFSLAKGKRGNLAVTINSEFIMLARRSEKFAEILRKSQVAVCDGSWVAFLKLILGGREKNRITGVELVDLLCKRAAKKPIRIGFLGGFGSVAETVAKRQKSKYPGLKVVFFEAGDPSYKYDNKIRAKLARAGRIDILFVAFGMGKQEFWMERNRKFANIGVLIGVGGAFDYLSGVKKRAPSLLSGIGLEWLWRLVLEPARIWRMRVLPAFFVLSLIFVISKKLKIS